MTKAEMMRERGLSAYQEAVEQARAAREKGDLREARDCYQQAEGMLSLLSRLTLISLNEQAQMTFDLIDNCYVSYVEIMQDALEKRETQT